jgi:hypothetical protein
MGELMAGGSRRASVERRNLALELTRGRPTMGTGTLEMTLDEPMYGLVVFDLKTGKQIFKSNAIESGIRGVIGHVKILNREEGMKGRVAIPWVEK